MPQFFHHHQIDLAQRDGLKINFSQISPESLLLNLIADYAENYTHLAQVPYLWNFFHFPLPHDKSAVFDLQLMSQMRWFHKLSSVILIILAHYWDYELNRRLCCAHHCISDDLNKSNEQMTHCFDFVRYTFLFTKLMCNWTELSTPWPPYMFLFRCQKLLWSKECPAGSSSAATQTSPDRYRQCWKSMQKCVSIQLDDWLCQWRSWSWNNPT